MKKLLSTEIRLQWRQGFWLVYFIVSSIYALVLLNIPQENRLVVSLLMILSDTTMLGVLFIGALVWMEKQQDVIRSLFVTPLKPGQYIWSKTLALSLIATVMSILIYLPVWQFNAYTFLILLVTLLTALTFTLLGLGMASGVQGINQYFGMMMAVSMLITLPVIPYLLLDRHPAFLPLPYIASLDLMLGALHPLPAWRIVLDLCLLSGWSYVAYRFCLVQVNRKLVYA